MAKKAKKKAKPGTAVVPAGQASRAIAEKPVKTKALSAKKKSPTKAELVALEEAAELLTKIEEAEEACQQSRLDMDDAKESYKLAKQNYSHHVDELRRLVRARKEDHPLFDQPKQTVIDVEVKPSAEGQSVPEGTSAPALPGPSVNGKAKAWRYLEVDRLVEADSRITEKHLKALRASKYETLGELADMMDRRETFWHKEVKGIGKDGKQPIEDALGMIRARYETEQSEPEKPSESKESKED